MLWSKSNMQSHGEVWRLYHVKYKKEQHRVTIRESLIEITSMYPIPKHGPGIWNPVLNKQAHPTHNCLHYFAASILKMTGRVKWSSVLKAIIVVSALTHPTCHLASLQLSRKYGWGQLHFPYKSYHDTCHALDSYTISILCQSHIAWWKVEKP